MTANQIKYLKLLGYVDVDEEGAILSHRKLSQENKFVWKDDTFETILSHFPSSLEHGLREDIACIVRYG